jgi:RNA polymerase sigma factor (sigma-70 family)
MKPGLALGLAKSPPMPPDPVPPTEPLGEPALRKQLEDFVRRRVPPGEVEDVVQTVLCDALASARRPEDPTELTKWVIGIARHKVVDVHRSHRREPPAEPTEIEASPPPIEERGMAMWAEEQAGSTRDAQQTLAWMAREGEGEKLEAIASEEKIPAARVRQRVSRMRRWMKERWLAELAAAAALAVLAFVLYRLLHPKEEAPEAIRPDRPVPSGTLLPEAPSPLDQARLLRADALEKCDRSLWQGCLDGLEQAAQLDPAGDQDPAVAAARAKAKDALNPAPDVTSETKSPAPAPSPLPGPKSLPAPAPSTTAAPAPGPTKSDPSDDPSKSAPSFTKKSAPTPGPSKATGKSAKPSPTMK